MPKAPRTPKKQPGPVGTVPRVSPHLKKEELKRVDDLRVNIMTNRGQKTPDVQSTLELMYLRVLGQVKNRTAVDSELKALKKTLDQAATQISKILGNADDKAASK